ncbi:hypothetical protein F5Y18DRAFT_427852 [Xylariaceae sp. FL1019]|nr:hypothetical protein F5Y18DRAFT_427852 [Xylariaceae sp. FL1019]
MESDENWHVYAATPCAGSPATEVTMSDTMIPTPASSIAGEGAKSETAQHPAPARRLVTSVTSQSVTSWRTAYPPIGQFAMTESQEIVAACPDGLYYFARIRDHASMPWSEMQRLPSNRLSLNSSNVSGLAICPVQREGTGCVDIYCVSNGAMHRFRRSGNTTNPFVVDRSPPFAGRRVCGTPSVARLYSAFLTHTIQVPRTYIIYVPVNGRKTST